MSFGGFLGIGDSYHPLPWKSLTYDTDKGGYVVDLDRARLEGAPRFRANEDPWSDRDLRAVDLRLLRDRLPLLTAETGSAGGHSGARHQTSGSQPIQSP